MPLQDTIGEFSDGPLGESVSLLQTALARVTEHAREFSQGLDAAREIGTSLQTISLDPARDAAPLPFVFGDSLAAALETFDRFKASIATKVDQIESELKALSAAGEGIAERFQSELAQQIEAFDDKFEVLVSALEAHEERLGAGFDELQDGVRERFETIGESLQAFLDDVLWDKPEEALKNATEMLEDTLDDCTELVGEISDALMESLAECLDELADHARDSAEEAIERVALSLIDIARDLLATEAVDAVLEMQIGAQVTTMLQPYLPQLMVASAVAPAVQQALDVMRAGM